MRAVLRTLAQCHAHKILHRDIKPGNFMLLSEADDAPLKAIGGPPLPLPLPLALLLLGDLPTALQEPRPLVLPEALEHGAAAAAGRWLQ